MSGTIILGTSRRSKGVKRKTEDRGHKEVGTGKRRSKKSDIPRTNAKTLKSLNGNRKPREEVMARETGSTEEEGISMATEKGATAGKETMVEMPEEMPEKGIQSS